METWLAEGHWQWLRAGGGGSEGDLCRICGLGPLGSRQNWGSSLSVCHVVCSSPLALPIVTQKVLQLGNCPSTAELLE